MKTGINASKLAIGAFVVPYIFCMNPTMLLIDVTAFKVIQIIVTSLIGIFGVAAAMNGYLFRRMSWPVRIVICVAGLMMMDPTVITDVVGMVLMAVILVFQYLAAKKAKPQAA